MKAAKINDCLVKDLPTFSDGNQSAKIDVENCDDVKGDKNFHARGKEIISFSMENRLNQSEFSSFLDAIIENEMGKKRNKDNVKV